SKYADTPDTLESACVSELIDVIQTSKLDVKLDIRLYKSCRKSLTNVCTGMDQENCLKLLYQNGKLEDGDCKEQVKRIIREGQADIHADRALSFACQVDVLKYCNDIPIGSGKQLQCLLSMGKSVTSECQNILEKRRELWQSVYNAYGVSGLASPVLRSTNNGHCLRSILLFSSFIIMTGLIYCAYVQQPYPEIIINDLK
ncbi:unnamed protein product, partial [Rotaria magnacalcarata]